MAISNAVPLVTEPHPENYKGYPFITLIRYNNENVLTNIDNVTKTQVIGFVLDMCSQHNLNEMAIVNVARDWFESGRNKHHPLSIEFSCMGLAGDISPIVRAYPIEYVSRIIGPLPSYKMAGAYKTRKKRRKDLPDGIDIVVKDLSGTIIDGIKKSDF